MRGTCLLLVACVSDSIALDASTDAGVPDAPLADSAPEAQVEAGPTACPLDKPFDVPTPLSTLNQSGSNEPYISLTDDELEAVYSSNFGGNYDLLETTRASATVDFSPGQKTLLGKINTTADEQDVSISSDGLTLVFARYISGYRHLFVSKRLSRGDAWGDPTQLNAVVNTGVGEALSPFLTRDGKSLYFASSSTGTYGIYVTDWPNVTTKAVAYATSDVTISPVFDTTELTLFYAGYPSGTYADIYRVSRPKIGLPWLAAQKQTELSVAGVHDLPSWLSADNCRLYMARQLGAPSGTELFLAVRRP